MRLPSKSAQHAAGEVFGFRADGEWLVFREQGRKELEEWSPRTGKVRPSDFAERSRDASRICLSPDDAHFIAVVGDGDLTVMRSRESSVETLLDLMPFAPLPLTDCAFSSGGKLFALASEHHVAIYRLDESQPVFWLPIANASHLTWSADSGELTFAVREQEASAWLIFRWKPGSNAIWAKLLGGPGVLDHQGRIVTRSDCEWQRTIADGRTLARLGPPAQTCFHVHAEDIVLSPDGRFAAALEGEWGTRAIITFAVP